MNLQNFVTNYDTDLLFEVLTAIKLSIVVLWVVTSCDLVCTVPTTIWCRNPEDHSQYHIEFHGTRSRSLLLFEDTRTNVKLTGSYRLIFF
jgi:hypothetical protein